MGEKRMFAKSIVMSDAFLDMPMSARCLYFTLGMFGDDDGFVNSPKSIMRQIGASIDDMNVLIAKKFVLLFESGVIVIKHWRINNYLRNDRYKETSYQDEKAQLNVREDGAYEMLGIPTVDQRYTNGIPNITQHNLTEHNKTNNEHFDEFWSLYPKKVEKKKAMAVFIKINPDDDLFSTMIEAIKKQKQSDQWQRGFVPNPTTWLNGERWNDDLPKAKTKKPVCMERESIADTGFGLDYLKEV